MITEDYVSFETAKLLKDTGFKIPYDSFRGVYINGIFKRLNPGGAYGHNSEDEIVEVCSLQMAMKWLRKKYNIHIEPRYFPMPNIYRYVIIHSPMTIENIDSHPQYFNTYEEACETAIKYCLENLI